MVQMLQLGSDIAVSSNSQTLTESGNSPQEKKKKKVWEDLPLVNGFRDLSVVDREKLFLVIRGIL